MVIALWANFEQELKLVQENTFLGQAKQFKENGLEIIMRMAKLSIITETSMKDRYINHKKVVQENIYTRMEINIEDIGEMIKRKEKDNFGLKTVLAMQGIGIKINSCIIKILIKMIIPIKTHQNINS